MALLWSGPGLALDIQGALTPGGLIHVRLTPGASATLNGEAVPVGKDGLLVAGFGRDAKAEQVLTVTAPGGMTKRHLLTLKPRTYRIQRIDGLPKKKVTPPKRDWDRIGREAKLLNEARDARSGRRDFLNGFVWPAKGRISGVFGSQRVLNGKPRRPHAGVDIAAPTGTPVFAAASGVVALTHPGMFFAGKTVLIDHGHGVSTIYIHLLEIAVKDGQAVKQGQRIGRIGKTGRATGPHLHWGLAWGRVRLDPALLVGPMPE